MCQALTVLVTQEWSSPGAFSLVRVCYHTDTLCPAAYRHRFLGPAAVCVHVDLLKQLCSLCLCKYLLPSIIPGSGGILSLGNLS